MAKFRWHRGSLEDSLKTEVEVNDFDELYVYIKVSLSSFGVDVRKDEISISHYGYDHRISENMYIININNYGVVGFANDSFAMC